MAAQRNAPTAAPAARTSVSPALADCIDWRRYRLHSDGFQSRCKRTLDSAGVLVMPAFLTPSAIASLQSEGATHQHLAYYTADSHNIYLQPDDPAYPPEHPRNRRLASSKGCITTDQIPADSVLHRLYNAVPLRAFLCAVLDEVELHPYADPLSSINIHYARAGQALGWHFDNSSFAITLLIQKAESGGVFEYVKDVRDALRGAMNHTLATAILDGRVAAETVDMENGTLVLFRGRRALHRVTAVVGTRTRMLAVLAYNTEPGVMLSSSARMTFYGRLA